jgi:hypothetical protein
MSDWIVEIQQLGELRDAGLLNEEEFTEQKALVLPAQQDLPEPPTGDFPCDPHEDPDCSECFETFEWTWACIERNCGSCGFCLAAASVRLNTLLTKGSAYLNSVLRASNLAGVDLRDADLFGFDLSGANLQGSDMRGVDMRQSDLSGANLQGANLQHTKLFRANLAGADLSEANLVGADLTQANLASANLAGADLSQARLYGASLAAADLSGAMIDKKIPNGVDLTSVIGYNP